MTTSSAAKTVAAPIPDSVPVRRARSAAAKDRVRQALIEAGRDLLLAAPLTPISLRGIARHAGYSSGVIYRYFADRDALFLAIRDSELENFVLGLEEDFPPGGDFEIRLFGIAERAFDFSRHQIISFGIDSLFLFWLNRSGPENEKAVHDAAPAAARIHAFFEGAVASLISSGKTPNFDLRVAVGSLMAAIIGSVLLPGSSDHGAFSNGHVVMRETMTALISRWRG